MAKPPNDDDNKNVVNIEVAIISSVDVLRLIHAANVNDDFDHSIVTHHIAVDLLFVSRTTK